MYSWAAGRSGYSKGEYHQLFLCKLIWLKHFTQFIFFWPYVTSEMKSISSSSKHKEVKGNIRFSDDTLKWIARILYFFFQMIVHLLFVPYLDDF